MNFVFKLYHKTLGVHTHFRLFSGQQNRGTLVNWGCCGSFAMRSDEAKAFMEVLKRGSGDGGEVQLEEDK